MNRFDDGFPYEDMIDLPHPVSKTRPQMPMRDRAAQFSPFMALSGYEEAVRETARVTDEEIYLDEDSKTELDRKLRALTETQMQTAEAVITYFEPDSKKTGGAYLTATGRIRKIDEFERIVKMMDGSDIHIERIVALEYIQQDE